MTKSADPLDREWALLDALVDPMAHAVLAAADPREAYKAALEYGPLLEDPDLPHVGGLYVAWAVLTDLFETGKTDEAAAYEIIRTAATDWLTRPAAPSSDWIEGWIARSREASRKRFRHDGDFWRGPST